MRLFDSWLLGAFAFWRCISQVIASNESSEFHLMKRAAAVAVNGSWDSLVYGAILLLVGTQLLIASAGYVWLFCGLMCFQLGASVALVCLWNVNYDLASAELMYFFVALGSGLALALVALVLVLRWNSVKLPIMLSSGFGGIAVATWIETVGLSAGILTSNAPARALLFLFSFMLLSILSYFAARPCIVFAGASAGAYLFVLGIDMYVQKGIVHSLPVLFEFSQPKSAPYQPGLADYLYVTGAAVLAIVSMVWQVNRYPVMSRREREGKVFS